MLLTEASGASHNESQITQVKENILGICLDIPTYVSICRRIFEHWDEEHTKKQSSQPKGPGPNMPKDRRFGAAADSLKILPDSMTIDIRHKIIHEALDRIEKFNKSITNPRLRRYSKNAPSDQLTDTKNRFYMRKSLLEIKLRGLQQLSTDDHVFHFQEDARYQYSPWYALSYEAYNELPREVDWEPVMMDELGIVG